LIITEYGKRGRNARAFLLNFINPAVTQFAMTLKKWRRITAVQDAARHMAVLAIREASWTAPVFPAFIWMTFPCEPEQGQVELPSPSYFLKNIGGYLAQKSVSCLSLRLSTDNI
jgi:hypothetical protein